MKRIAASSLVAAFVGSIAPSEAVIGGTTAAPGRIPYFVSLVDEDDAHECGGTLIAPDMVITSASCSAASAKVGFESVTKNSFEKIGIGGEFVHPDWNSATGAWDVMILKLERASSKQWIRVNSDTSYPTVIPAVQIEAVGIGQTSVTSEFATELQYMSLVAIADYSCVAFVRTGEAQGVYKQLPSDHHCFTDYSFSMNGQCFGDEGGPLVELVGSPTDDFLVAVMSSVSGTCSAEASGYPTRGTATSSAYDFITMTVCENSSAPPSYMECDPVVTPSPVASGATDTPAPASPPTPAPVVPPTPAPVVPPTPAPVIPPTPVPVAAPTLAPINPPTNAPVLPPTETPVAATPQPVDATPAPNAQVGRCLPRNAQCNESFDCCSNRCVLGECQANVSTARFSQRTSLRREGSGGAAGAVQLFNGGPFPGFGFFGFGN